MAAQTWRGKVRRSGINNLLQTDNIQQLHIISDSLTVVEWIRGRYRIKNPRMQGLIDDILYMMYILRRENDVEIYVRWVKAHAGTIGNELADSLAKQGLTEVLDLRDANETYIKDAWRWYNFRAACRYCRRWFKRNQERKLKVKIRKSRFGRLIREEMDRNIKAITNETDADYAINELKRTRKGKHIIGYRWSRRWLRESQDLTRSDIRVLIMLRTGHDRLKFYTHYAHQKGDNADCPCGNGEQHLNHLLRDCTLPLVRYLRRKLHALLHDVYQRNINRPADDPDLLKGRLCDYIHNEQVITNMPTADQYHDPGTYIYPDPRLPRHEQRLLQREICHMYKLLRRKRRR